MLCPFESRAVPSFPPSLLFPCHWLVAEAGSVVLQIVPHSGRICFLVVSVFCSSVAWLSHNRKLTLEACLDSGLTFSVGSSMCFMLYHNRERLLNSIRSYKILMNAEFGLGVVLGTVNTTKMNKVYSYHLKFLSESRPWPTACQRYSQGTGESVTFIWERWPKKPLKLLYSEKAYVET